MADDDLPDDPITPLQMWGIAVNESYLTLQGAGFTSKQAFDLVLHGADDGWFDDWSPLGPSPERSPVGDEDEDGDDG